jgi:predicted nucleotidyltransferase component of viral defense system
MAMPELSDFYLVGGTALSLQFGHRISVDLDLFSTIDFDNATLAKNLETKITTFTYHSTLNPIGLFCYIEDIKVDFVKHHQHPLIADTLENDGIRMFSLEDIVAMKVNAILKRGAKKDFWDIAVLLKHFTIEDIVQFYNRKYPSQQLLISVPQALIYFDDAEDSEEPVSLEGQTWESIKLDIQNAVRNYLR